MRYRFIFLLAAVCGLLSVTDIKGQAIINPADEDFFKSMFPPKDSTNLDDIYFQDKLIDRFSFHVNVVDWVLTLPSVGIEFDLNKKFVMDENKKRTWKTNRTLLLFGKYNGNTKHTVTPKFVFNVGSVRMEFRKYWRTGKIGLNEFPHEDYRTMNLYKPDTLWRKVKKVDDDRLSKTYGDTILVKEYYFSHSDSVRLKKILNISEDTPSENVYFTTYEYDGDPSRGRFSNVYENARRVISTRTIDNARNWRAYYIGAFAGWDKYSWCFGKKGEQGTILSVGATFGWSIPLLATSDKGRGLDLDLGLNIGLPFAKYEGYKYVYQENNSYYAHTGRTLSDGWTINPKYIARDVHVSLVYRFRSISRKVSLAIVDDYQKHIDDWKNRRQKMMEEERAIKEAWEKRLQDKKEREAHQTDSASWADWTRKEYLEAMKELYPDRPWQSREDSLDYIRLVLGIDTTDYIQVHAREERLKAQREQFIKDSLDYIQKIAERDSTDKAKREQRKQKRLDEQARKDSIAHAKDSLTHLRDSLDKIRKDSLTQVREANQKLKEAEAEAKRDSLDKIKKEEQAKKNAERRAQMLQKAEEEGKKQAEQNAKKAAAQAEKDSLELEAKQKRIQDELDRRERERTRAQEKEQRKAEEAAHKEAQEKMKAQEAEDKKAQKEAEERRRQQQKEQAAQEAETKKQRDAEEAEERKAAAEAKKEQAAKEKEEKAQKAAAEKDKAKAEAEAKKQADKEAKEKAKAEAEAKKQAEKEAKEAQKRAEQEAKEAAKAAKEAAAKGGKSEE